MLTFVVLIGAAVAGYMQAPWLVVPIAALVLFAASTMLRTQTRRVQSAQLVAMGEGGHVFSGTLVSLVVACLWVAVPFSVGRGAAWMF